MSVVVMKFVEGRRVDDDKPCLPEEVLGPLQITISALHDKKLVYGDLRGLFLKMGKVVSMQRWGAKKEMCLIWLILICN